jgi:hypothetical protein
MSKLKIIAGLLIIVALITAGCTGTKTIVGKDQTSVSAGQTAAKDAYTKTLSDLKGEVDYLMNFYKLSNNTTLDEYKTWLGGFGDKLALCRQLYNNTSSAADDYLQYLNSSSSEYQNVTATRTNLGDDINKLNTTYWEYSDNFNTSVNKTAALQLYKDRLNTTIDSYDDLTAFAKNVKLGSIDAYGNFVNSFRQKTSTFDSSVKDAIAAGDAYKQYLDTDGAEYKAVDANDNALRDNVQKCWDAYNKYESDYQGKMGSNTAMQSTFTDYVGKVTKAINDKKDIDSYNATAKTPFDKLARGWLDGYKQRVDTFDADCNAAINAGNACLQYLSPTSSDYKSVTDNIKNMQAYMAGYDSYYSKINAMYNNLHPMGTFV